MTSIIVAAVLGFVAGYAVCYFKGAAVRADLAKAKADVLALKTQAFNRVDAAANAIKGK
ncbi:MAG: hypothetical protein KGL39_14695 [Patescibacteria group bacterium]|nr:hypothetical protein [Patescibacteria group bacterium]